MSTVTAPELDERTRIVVTGLGVKSPAGLDVDTMWATLLAGTSATAEITGFDASDHPVKYACEVRDFEPADYLGTKGARRADRVAQLGVSAAMDAWRDAGEPSLDPARVGVVAGTGIGGLATLESQVALAIEKGMERVSPFLVPQMMPNATAALVSLEYGFTGPNLCVATACAAGAHAIGEAARLVRTGAADAVVAGGTEASITPTALAAFWRMGALSGFADPPRASRPFDEARDGFVMGEGAAFVVLETLDHARGRGARVLGEILGYALTGDAHHITAPAPGGAGAVAAMEQALADAGLAPAEIMHVNAHGTSTPLNDAAESAAVAKVFGDFGVPITSVKGVTGHLVGAAGAVEAVAALLSASAGLIPPTANHERTDPELAVDVVAGSPRKAGPGPVLSNSFGFGGHNATLILGPPPPT